MKVFLIDRNIDGLLSALYVSFVENLIPKEVQEKNIYQIRADAVSIDIPTDKQHSDRVKKALYKYGGDDIIAHLKVCLASCLPTALTTAFNYARLTLSYRTDVSKRFEEKCVTDFSFVLQKVLHERHVVTGFLRFKESANGVMYARYSPDNDVTYLIAQHFLKRLGKTPFIIHDINRNVIAISNGQNTLVTRTNLPANFVPSDNEEDCNLLWRKYFSAINIKERINPSQQVNFFPHRYRKFCFEMWEYF
jgi:probable DNA metabolism protein